MREQLIVTISRESGSAGHSIAQKLAQRLEIKLLDKDLIENTVKLSGYPREDVQAFDEKPVNVFLYRRIGKYSNSPEENVAEKTFTFIRRHAAAGESFVLLGRCGNFILRDNPNAVHVFVRGDYEAKLRHVMENYGLTEREAADEIRDTDRRRKYYHNYYSDAKWGDSRAYDVCVNSSKLGIEKTADALARYIEAFRSL